MIAKNIVGRLIEFCRLSNEEKSRRILYKIYAHYRFYYESLFQAKYFSFQSKKFKYFRRFSTFRTERTVEIALLSGLLSDYKKDQILEVGAVSYGYLEACWDVVDKYEQKPGVINVDIVDFVPDKKKDFIFSISTLEHIGWDEKNGVYPKKPNGQKLIKAFEHMKSLLSARGKMVFTIPRGYNLMLDSLIDSDQIRFTEKFYLKRHSNNIWKEALFCEIKDMGYDYDSGSAAALMVGFFMKGQFVSAQNELEI